MAAGVSLSSSASEATTRASSMGPEVLRAALAERILAFMAIPETGSTTTGTSFRPSHCQTTMRLNPSMTSKPPSGVRATRMGMGARSVRRSECSPRNGAREVRNWSMGTKRTRLIACGPRREGSDAGESGRR
jgi:hypothetical protein